MIKQEEVKTKRPDPINAWYYNENGDLPCMPHQYNPNRAVSQEHLDSESRFSTTLTASVNVQAGNGSVLRFAFRLY